MTRSVEVGCLGKEQQFNNVNEDLSDLSALPFLMMLAFVFMVAWWMLPLASHLHSEQGFGFSVCVERDTLSIRLLLTSHGPELCHMPILRLLTGQGEWDAHDWFRPVRISLLDSAVGTYPSWCQGISAHYLNKLGFCFHAEGGNECWVDNKECLPQI